LKRSSTFNMLGQVHRGLICRRICATPTLRTRTLIGPMTTTSGGHQYVDVSGGLASQIMISVNEYPESLRR
jgi:hypothetical protein